MTVIAFIICGFIVSPVNLAVPLQSESSSAKGARTEGFRLVVSVPKTTFSLGEEIPVTLTLENTSPHTLTLQESGVFGDFDFRFRDSSGVELPYRGDFEKVRESAGILGMHSVTVEPGKSYSCSVDLTTVFQVTRRGTFTPSFKRAVPKAGRARFAWVTARGPKITIQ